MSGYRFDILPASFDALLVASGSDPGAKVFREVLKRSRFHIALDGGTAIFRKRKAVPDFIIGDLDSVTEEDLKWAKKSGSHTIRNRSQLSSDFEKGLELCRKKKWKSIAVMAADGSRPDHTLYSLSSAFAATELHVSFMTSQSISYVLNGPFHLEFHLPKRHTVSWIGYPRAENCTLLGVKWPFRNRVIRQDGFQSLSNLSASDTISASSRSGSSLLVIGLCPEN